MSRAGSRRSGKDSYVDESLFGESQATKMRKARQAGKFSKFGKTIMNEQDNSPLVISRMQFEAIKARANGQVRRAKAVQRKKGPSISRLSRPKPTVAQEYERRRRQVGEGGANAKAAAMMDEELDEVKALKQRLNLMKVKRIRQKQVTEKSAQDINEREYDEYWDKTMTANNDQEIQREMKRLVALKERQQGYAKELVRQVEHRERDKILEQERLEQEKVQMRQQIERLKEQEREKQRKKKIIHEQRRAYLVKENKKSARYKGLKQRAEEDEDQRILAYIREKDYVIEMKLAEENREKRERELEVARLRALQERSTDKKAQEDAKRAKRLQQEHERAEDLKHAAKAAQKKAMMEEVLRERAKQIALQKQQATREKKADREFMARIKREQVGQMQREENLRREKQEQAYAHAQEVLTLNEKRLKDEKLKKAKQREIDQRNAMDADVYHHRVKQVFKDKMAQHKAQGYELPPDLARPQESEEEKRARKAKFYRSRPLW